MALIARIWAFLGAGQAADIVAALRDRLASDGLVPLSPRQRSGWDRLMDALNRLPRPLMALGTLAVIAAALVAPDWFSARMDALSAMPEAMWWLIGAIVSLFFGARFQASEQAFARELIAATLPPDPLQQAATGTDAELTLAAERPGENAALADLARG